MAADESVPENLPKSYRMRRLSELQTLNENVKRENWEQVKVIFNRALAVAPRERDEYLSETCAGDKDLRRDVEILLASFDSTENFLENPAVDEYADLLDDGQTELKTGEIVAHYEILASLGAGGMGDVYLAQDTKLNRRVALKFLSADAVNSNSRKRFQREAQAVAALDHPHICAIHEIAETDGQTFIAMQYVEGETLAEKLIREKPGLSETVEIAVQIADALTEAHSRGIIHRDIKPANVIVNSRSSVKVLDFGLAKMQEGENKSDAGNFFSRSLTTPGLIMGTVAYMSPEQARGLPVDGRTDIWSLGVVLYEMLAGKLPFAGDTTSDIIAAILKSEPPLADLAAAPEDLQAIVSKSLSKNLADRYASTAEMLADLRCVKKQLELFFDKTTVPNLHLSSIKDAETTVDCSPETNRENSKYQTASQTFAPVVSRQNFWLAALAFVAVFTVGLFVYSRYFGGNGRTDFAAQGAGIRSIAVLPFTNQSGEPDLEYLSDGISESLINSLSPLPDLKVIARTSSFKYKDKEADLPQIAEALGVEAVLTGRITQRGDNILINVELVKAADQTQIWGGSYSRRAEDLLNVQWEVSKDIAGRLRLRLNGVQERQLAKRETTNPAAYELVLRARFYWNKGGTENRKRAVEFLNQAIVADPNYALAHAELSTRYGNLVAYNILEPKEYLPKAEAAAQKALELDANSAEAHLALANLKRDAWKWLEAEQAYRRAIELNPNLARARSGFAGYLSDVGRHDEAIAEIKRAGELDPLSLPINTTVGYKFYYARRYDEAIESLKKTLELDRNYPSARIGLGSVFAAKGMYREAAAAFQEAIKLGGDTASVQILLGAALARSGEIERARAILKRLQASKEYVPPGETVILYVALNEREKAFESLEKAYSAHDLHLQFLGVEPAFDSLRPDARFQDLLRRVGLTQ